VKKLFLLPASFIIILLLLIPATPVTAEERSVIGFNLPFTICYEKEFTKNRSWVVNGLLYVDDSFANYDISLTCYSGIRLYHGNNPGRFYEGIYGYCSFKGVEALPSTIESNYGTMGVLGYEWRLGSNKKMRLCIEGGLIIMYSGSDGFKCNPTIEAGFGFNI
jgi:hypothetical protein